MTVRIEPLTIPVDTIDLTAEAAVVVYSASGDSDGIARHLLVHTSETGSYRIRFDRQLFLLFVGSLIENSQIAPNVWRQLADAVIAAPGDTFAIANRTDPAE